MEENDTEPGPQAPPDPNPTHTPSNPGGDESASQGGVGKALWALYSELAKIRMLLQAQHQAQSQPGDVTYYHCSLCEETIPGEKRAKRHAVKDHGAPRDAWKEPFREVDP